MGELYPITLLFVLLIANRYVLGTFLRRVRSRTVDAVDDTYEPHVAVHSVTPLALLLAYPVVIIQNLVNDEFWEVMAVHLLVVGALGLIYRLETRRLPEHMRVGALSFLPIALLMPVTYALFTPLALLTLDSGSWETRGGVRAPRSGWMAGGCRCG